DWTAGAGLSGYAERIVMPIVFLELIIEKTELLGPLTRIFPVRNEIGEPVGQQLRREFFNGAAHQLILPTERKPRDEACALLAQIAKNRRFLRGGNDADETTLIDLDQPIKVWIGLSGLVRVEPVDDRMFDSWGKSGCGFRVRRVLEENLAGVANGIKQRVVWKEIGDPPTN